MKLLKAMATVAGLTGLSRVAGFIRDILTAVILGAGPVSDAFFVALKLPNLFRRITAEGAFSVSFTPLYTGILAREGEEAAGAFADKVFAIMLWSLLIFTFFALMLMPYIIIAIAPGFLGDLTRFPGAVEMARVTFPYLPMMSVAALMGAMLNAHRRFAPFAAAPILFNLTLIAFLFASGAFKTPGHALAWGVFFAGILQCALLALCLKRMNISLRFVMPDFSDEKVQRLFKLMGPGLLGAGVMHINLFADMIIASFLVTGSVSYLYFADRLYQLPVGMVGIALGTALLPMLSRAIADQDKAGARDLYSRAMEICLLLALPAGAGLALLSFPIIMTLFQHGEFSMKDAGATAMVLSAYAAGVPAYVAVKVTSTAYWAREDTFSPVKAAIVSTLLNIVAGLLFVFVLKIGVAGIALATSLAGWVQFVLLSRGLRGDADIALDARFRRSFPKIILCCAAMALFVFVAAMPVMKIYQFDGYYAYQVLALTMLISGGAAVYGAGIFLTGVIKPADVKKLFKRGTP